MVLYHERIMRCLPTWGRGWGGGGGWYWILNKRQRETDPTFTLVMREGDVRVTGFWSDRKAY